MNFVTGSETAANISERCNNNTVYAVDKNIVLIGMPSAGKTTIGSALAERLGLRFFDTDDEIIMRTGIPIAEFFSAHGEQAFRDIESEVITRCSALKSTVIATGGGSVLRRENLEALRQNGFLIFLDRAVELLSVSDTRPLASNREALERLYDARYEIYSTAADTRVINNGTIENAVRACESVFESSCAVNADYYGGVNI